jgi:phosphoribosylanthranilate isomerase
VSTVKVEILKICGITQVKDALEAVRGGATAIGLNFYPGSARFLEVSQGALIAGVVPRPVLKVGIFVDETSDRIRRTAGAVHLDVVQLHGAESPAECEALAPLRVWKAFRVGEDFDPSVLSDYSCEAFLLDAGGESGAWGGTGRTFPWAVARAAARYGKIIVAGGLDASNVAEAIRQAEPWGVDASSRLERSPGIKDPARVQEFLQEASRHAATV